jgi:hypothetical protein
MKIVTGIGENDHVTEVDFRNMLLGIIGPGNFIFSTGEQLKATLVSNNQLDIGTGMMCTDGNISVEGKGESIILTNGTQGMKRIDLIVNRYTRDESSQVEDNNWVYLQGTPDVANPIEPTHTEGSILAKDLTVDVPVYKLVLDGLNVTSVECLLPVLRPLSSKQSQIISVTSMPEDGTGEDGDVYILVES